MAARRTRFLRQKKGELVWLAAGFIVIQLGMAFGIERWLPVVRDPEYAVREKRLRARRAEAPDQPLVVMLGSSRTQLGLQAEALARESSGAVVFNFGQPGGGPMLDLVCLQRLLAGGVRPDLLFVEVTPPVLTQAGKFPMEEKLLNGARLSTAEMARLEPYYSEPLRLLKPWCLTQCLPCTRRRAELSSWLALDRTEPGDPFRYMDSHGWQPVCCAVTPDQRERWTGLAFSQYGDAVHDPRLADGPVRALRDLFDLCRKENIPTALVLMPEASPFRALYNPAVLIRIEAFLAELTKEKNMPLIDARHWVEDVDFYDSHHLLPTGAAVFTERFAREALRPLLNVISRQNQECAPEVGVARITERGAEVLHVSCP